MLSIIFGTIFLTLSVVLLFLNAVLLYTLLRYNEYKTTTYLIIKHICVANLLQLVPFAVGGVMTLARSVFSFHLDRVLGVMVKSGWFLYVVLSLVLAVDRLLIFIDKTSKFHHITSGLLALSWLFAIAIIVVLALPGCGNTYTSRVMWLNSKGDCSQWVMFLEPYFDMAIFGLILVIYLIVFFHLLKLKNTSSGGVFHAELRIFLVAIISFAYESILVIGGFYIPPLLADPLHAFIGINLTWIIDCGLFAVITLAFNGTLRRKLLSRKKISVSGTAFIRSIAK